MYALVIAHKNVNIDGRRLEEIEAADGLVLIFDPKVQEPEALDKFGAAISKVSDKLDLHLVKWHYDGYVLRVIVSR